MDREFNTNLKLPTECSFSPQEKVHFQNNKYEILNSEIDSRIDQYRERYLDKED